MRLDLTEARVQVGKGAEPETGPHGGQGCCRRG